MSYELVIWLEVHIKLNSENKLFCQCHNEQEFESLEINTNICPVCTWQPGALPVLSQEALDKAVQLWIALGCEVDRWSYFDRKSYFYPDLPMWYQITQQWRPTNINGEVNFFVDKEFKEQKTVRIRDAHIETDTGKSLHEDGKVVLDYNRSWTPLVEIVTHPDFRSTEEVVAFLKQLQRIAKFNKISDAELEKGQMRVDVNVSLKEEGSDEFGTRTETKNMNSFSGIIKAIEFEEKRQTEILRAWGEIEQQTRAWDATSWVSHVMRSKEDAMDYRYFPEPDLPVCELQDEYIDQMKDIVVEDPFLRIKKYKEEFAFNKEYINTLINDVDMNNTFEVLIKDGYEAKEVAKRMAGPIQRWLNDNVSAYKDIVFSEAYFREFLDRISSWELANQQAKVVIAEMLQSGKSAQEIIEEKGFKPISWEEIQTWISEIFEQQPELLEQMKSGDMKPKWFVIWQVMKKSWGAANPQMIGESLWKILA